MANSVCLVMVAKTDAEKFKRCLLSVLPFIQSAVIVVDTGDMEEYVKRCEEVLGEDFPCVIHGRVWRNISDSRNYAFGLAKTFAPSHFFVMDADDYLEEASLGTSAIHIDPEKDVYEFEIVDGNLRYWRPQIFKASLPNLRYTGSFHELATYDSPVTLVGKIESIKYIRTFDTLTPEQLKKKYNKFVNGLMIDHRANPKDARIVYYLAQSYKDAGNLVMAREWYAKRADMKDGWDEETWSAMYEAGNLSASSQLASNIVVAWYLRAWQFRPQRIEPLFQLARYFRIRGEYSLSYLFGFHAWGKIKAAESNDSFFGVSGERWLLERPIYIWRLMNEVAIAAYYVGQRQQSLTFFQTLILNSREWQIPEEELRFMVGNLELFK